jgi:hypothetical protein
MHGTRESRSNAEQVIVRLCDLCGEERSHGNWLKGQAGEPPVWVCEDCQRLLAVRADDKGPPGD